MILAAMAVANTASGIIGGYKAKQAAKSAYRKQKKLATLEYKFNRAELEKSFKSNLEINFSNTASDFFDITKNHLSQFSGVNMLTSKYSGTGLAMSSSIKDIKNVLTDEYLANLEQTRFKRNYTEETLSSQFTNNLYQLNLNKAKTQLGLSTALESAKLQANQQMFNSAVKGATTLNNIATDAGGFKEAFSFGGGN